MRGKGEEKRRGKGCFLILFPRFLFFWVQGGAKKKREIPQFFEGEHETNKFYDLISFIPYYY